MESDIWKFVGTLLFSVHSPVLMQRVGFESVLCKSKDDAARTISFCSVQWVRQGSFATCRKWTTSKDSSKELFHLSDHRHDFAMRTVPTFFQRVRLLSRVALAHHNTSHAQCFALPVFRIRLLCVLNLCADFLQAQQCLASAQGRTLLRLWGYLCVGVILTCEIEGTRDLLQTSACWYVLVSQTLRFQSTRLVSILGRFFMKSKLKTVVESAGKLKFGSSSQQRISNNFALLGRSIESNHSTINISVAEKTCSGLAWSESNLPIQKYSWVFSGPILLQLFLACLLVFISSFSCNLVSLIKC